jgi:hypothetical protein
MVSLRCWSTTPDERGTTAKIPDQPEFLDGTTFQDTRWEFAYIDLWLGVDKRIDSVGTAQGAIAACGQAGWEPVGEIRFEYREPQKAVGSTVVRQLMFKRPIQP